MAAAVIERGGEAPKTGGLNQLGEAWDMFYPSKYYSGTGYRGRYHTSGEHLGQIDPFGGVGTPTTTGDSNGEAWYSGILDFAKEAVPAYLAYDAQKDLMDLNLERARQGLDPVDPGIAAPQLTVVHQLPPEVQTGIADMKFAGMNILLWGGLAIGGFMLFRALL
jgi:hypothetical protein